ncbi:MAG: hypothetical protein ACLVL2_29315 [Bacteroides cellulosilyticus]
MKMKTLKEGIVAHADGLGKLFKFSAEHTCRSMLHSLEGFANMELVTFRELTAGFFLGSRTQFVGFGMFTKYFGMLFPSVAGYLQRG